MNWLSIFAAGFTHPTMKTIRYVYWQDDDFYLGYLEEFPDYLTQGTSLTELQENLRDILQDATGWLGLRP